MELLLAGAINLALQVHSLVFGRHRLPCQVEHVLEELFVDRVLDESSFLDCLGVEALENVSLLALIGIVTPLSPLLTLLAGSLPSRAVRSLITWVFGLLF